MPPWIMTEKGRKMSCLGDWLKGHVAGNHEISWDWPHLHQSTIQNAMFCRFCPPSLDIGEILQNYLVKIPSGTSNLNRLRQRHGFSLSKREHPTPMYSEIQACQCMSCLFPMHLHFRRFLGGVRLQLKKHATWSKWTGARLLQPKMLSLLQLWLSKLAMGPMDLWMIFFTVNES